MKRLLILLAVVTICKQSFSKECGINYKDSVKVEISLILLAADDMYKRHINSKNYSILFSDYYFKKFGYKTSFKQDSIYSFMKKNTGCSKKKQSINFLCFARIVLLNGKKNDTLFIGFKPHNLMYVNGKICKYPIGLSSYLYKILMDRYYKKDFLIIGTETNEVGFLVMVDTLFSPKKNKQ